MHNTAVTMGTQCCHHGNHIQTGMEFSLVPQTLRTAIQLKG